MSDVTEERRPRVGVVVEPRLLSDALTAVIRADGVDEVVDSGRVGREHLDALLITVDTATGSDADVVIQLPDSSGNAGIGLLLTDADTRPVWIDDAASILEILDRYCPGPGPRRRPIVGPND